MLKFDVTVHGQRGLHARPAARLVAETTRFQSDVRVRYGNKDVNAKSIMELLILAAPRGARLGVLVDGPDEVLAKSRVQNFFDTAALLPVDPNR